MKYELLPIGATFGLEHESDTLNPPVSVPTFVRVAKVPMLWLPVMMFAVLHERDGLPFVGAITGIHLESNVKVNTGKLI